MYLYFVALLAVTGGGAEAVDGLCVVLTGAAGAVHVAGGGVAVTLTPTGKEGIVNEHVYECGSTMCVILTSILPQHSDFFIVKKQVVSTHLRVGEKYDASEAFMFHTHRTREGKHFSLPWEIQKCRMSN